jgi:hypothetical protein
MIEKAQTGVKLGQKKNLKIKNYTEEQYYQRRDKNCLASDGLKIRNIIICILVSISFFGGSSTTIAHP